MLADKLRHDCFDCGTHGIRVSAADLDLKQTRVAKAPNVQSTASTVLLGRKEACQFRLLRSLRDGLGETLRFHPLNDDLRVLDPVGLSWLVRSWRCIIKSADTDERKTLAVCKKKKPGNQSKQRPRDQAAKQYDK
jgi:hypothetical protein